MLKRRFAQREIGDFKNKAQVCKEVKRARGGLRNTSDLHEAPQLSVQISKTAANAIINGAITIYAIVAV